MPLQDSGKDNSGIETGWDINDEAYPGSFDPVTKDILM